MLIFIERLMRVGLLLEWQRCGTFLCFIMMLRLVSCTDIVVILFHIVFLNTNVLVVAFVLLNGIHTSVC